ncbi:hypothetical protein B0T21DRAFT_416511 [Apiosordaria backusii]|uniref:Uncharacterized protein n=1 Tax=Apiosordaria backusii TaxID=314023 RepID=A0AA39ZYA1_9PEZI|nr:hypothetical protein B0T21DRAFT_416511 [Apiosordaria backusii]
MSAHWRRLFSVGRRQGGAQRQYLWNVPSGKQPDFSESYAHGQNIPISWNALNNSVYDLWLTTWNFETNPMALCLARAINLGHDGSLNLKTPNIPPETLSSRTRYVLRFKPQTKRGEYVPLDPELSSPAFFIVDSSQTVRAEPTSNSARPSQTTFQTTISTPTHTPTPLNTTVNTAFVPLTPNEDSTTSSENMSSGQAAALTIGLILAVALLVACEIAYLMWRRKQNRKVQHSRRLKNKSLYGAVHDPRERGTSLSNLATSTTNTTGNTRATVSTPVLTLGEADKRALVKSTGSSAPGNTSWSPLSWIRNWKWKASAEGKRGIFTRVVTTSRDLSNERGRKNSSKVEVEERETSQEHKDRWTMFNSPYTGPWMLVSPELPGDSSWGHYDRDGELVHELHDSNGRRGPGTINSSLVELDAEGGRWEEQRSGGR